jgi:hypothetical protein
MALPAKRRASYDDLLAVPDHKVAEIVNADGAVNGGQHDSNDQAFIEKNLGCSLWKECY